MRIVFSFLVIFIIFQLSAKMEFAAYPAAGYSNETEFYAGFLSYIRYPTANFSDSELKNVFYLSSSYSQKHQFNLYLNPTVHIRDGNYRWESEIQYLKWPSAFYGLGMNTNPDFFENYTAKELSFKTTFVKKINSNHELGLYYEITDFDIIQTENEGALTTGTISGSTGSTTAGAGVKFLYDNRDIVSFPTSGYLCSLQINKFSALTGSEYNFWELILDLRKYFQLTVHNTIAMQTYLCNISGQVPFNQMNYLDENMRAITSKLFVDKNAVLFRAEDRFFPWENSFGERIGFVFFGELGEVSSQVEKFNLPDLQFNFGLGLRYSFFVNDRLNVRFDLGFGEQNFNISIASGEAF